MEIFKIFIIRYINYINIWSVELNSDNFYDEFRDGILLVNLIKKWSNLYGYNIDGDFVIYKRPLTRNQALNNINICINFIKKPPEKSNLPEYLNEKETITAEDIYEKNEAEVIRFINNIFHHYLIPYLRLNSKRILKNMNEYLLCHGLSFSDESINEFYKMIPKNNHFSDELNERIESWERYLSYNINEFENKDYQNTIRNKEINNKFSSKYINPLQCDVTSNGFILLMIILYHMGWIDTSILCQMYYIPKTFEEYRWNHEIVYYAFQTIINYLNVQKELSIINNTNVTSNNNELEDESEDETDNIRSCEIPFVLIPLSSIYMINFSPYILLLQIEILHNLLTQQVDSSFDISFNTKKPSVYGPYQPIGLDLLDELTYKDNYPLNWTDNSYSQVEFNHLSGDLNKKTFISSEYNEINDSIYDNDFKHNFDEIQFENEEYETENQEDLNMNNQEQFEMGNSDMGFANINKNCKNNNELFESSKFEDNNTKKLFDQNSLDIIKNLNTNKKESNSKTVSSVEKIQNNEINEMFTGLEKELELLKIYDNETEKKSDLTDGFFHLNKIKMLQNEIIGNSNSLKEHLPINIEAENKKNIRVKPFISRSALEEQKKIYEQAKKDEEEYTAKVFDITRKPRGVIEKISNAINENNKLLEKLKMSMNSDSKHTETLTTNQEKANSTSKTHTIEAKENNNNSLNEISTPINQETKKSLIKKSPKKINKSKCAGKVSFSDRVQMEVERSSKKTQ